jgi:hypothetical protein
MKVGDLPDPLLGDGSSFTEGEYGGIADILAVAHAIPGDMDNKSLAPPVAYLESEAFGIFVPDDILLGSGFTVRNNSPCEV